LQFSTSYVLGKSLDSNSSPNGGVSLVDPTNIRHNRGRSDWDRRHAFVLSGIWTLPVFTNNTALLGKILGGWSLSSITIAQSGLPLTFDSGQNTQLNGTGVNSRADLVGDPRREHNSRSDMIRGYFNTEAFSTPGPGSPGSSGRGILSGPPLVNTDLAILKEVKIREGYQFQLRGEFFNVFNQVNFTRVRTSMANANFGQIDQAASGRTAQLGLKFLW
jgi:hypothetical protein